MSSGGFLNKSFDRGHERPDRDGFGEIALSPGIADAFLVALAGIGGDGQHRDRAQRGSALACSIRSRPETLGSWISMMIRLGTNSRALPSASSPSAHGSTA